MSKHGKSTSKIGNYSNINNNNNNSSSSNSNSNSYVNYHLTKRGVNNNSNNNNIHWIFHIDEEDSIDDANTSLLEELEVDPANIYRLVMYSK